jgi:DNA-binding GntR family transcriptional regulator
VTEPRTPLLKVSLVDQVADTIRDRIAAGQIAPGETLRIETLARELGVSRTPIREAISRLEAQGLLVRRTGYAATVFEPVRKGVLELYEMRMVLEPLAARLALPHMTPDLLGELDRLVQGMDDFETANWYRLNRQFHSALYAAADRPFLVATIENLVARADPYIRIYFSGHDLEETQRGHRRILDAARRGDNESLVAAVVEHLDAVVAGILEVIDEEH